MTALLRYRASDADVTVPGALATPMRHVRWGYTSYGLYDNAGKRLPLYPILISADSRFPYMPAAPARAEVDQLPGSYIYGGLFDERFGHFFTETVPSLVTVADAARRHPDARFLFHRWSRFSLSDLTMPKNGFMAWFLNWAGIDPDRVVLIDRPMQLDQLIVPPTPFSAKFRYTRRALDLMDALDPTPAASGGVGIFASRLGRGKPRLYNEDAVEAVFRAAGFDMLYLEDHPLKEQVALVKGARVIAGSQGSALHWSLYSKDTAAVFSLGGKSHLQAGICAGRGQRYIENRGWMKDPRKDRIRWVSPARVERQLSRLLDGLG